MAWGIGWIFSLFGLLTIVGATCLSVWLFLANTDYFEINEPVVPTVAAGLLSLIIGSSFLSIFTFSSDAILQSFILDEELGF